MNTEELKEYLRDVYELEKTLYSQNAYYNMLVEAKRSLEVIRDIPLKRFESEDSDAVSGFLIIGEIVGIIIGEILVFIFSSENQAWNKFIIGLLVGAVIGLLVFGILICIENRQLDKENKKIEEENQKIQLMNEKNHEKARWKIKQIEREMNKVSDAYYKTEDILSSYYSLA